MAECSTDYTPNPDWKGYDYTAARKAYDPGASYSGGASKGRSSGASSASDVPASLTTDAKSPIIIVVDGTGSMGTFPETIFKKLPLLDDCARDYLEGVQFSFAMIGDAGSDRYALQVQPFCAGTGMVESLNKLVIEGNGGANAQESYDLAALYYLSNVKTPKATNKPILIFVCDEGVYHTVDKDWAKAHAKVDLKEKMTDKTLFAKLSEKYSVYAIRKHYGVEQEDGKMTGANLRIHEQWSGLVGGERITILQDPARVVDLILGILATETDKLAFFEHELTERQRPDQVEEVMHSMISLSKAKTRADKTGGKSIAKRPGKSVTKKTKSLLE